MIVVVRYIGTIAISGDVIQIGRHKVAFVTVKRLALSKFRPISQEYLARY